jgi:acyl phosphate:glycerol-3-phosphate acyltransferase
MDLGDGGLSNGNEQRNRKARITMATWTVLIVAVAFGYLLGSIPFGLLLTRAAGLGDVRNIGSGSIGATNVLRTGNKSLAAATVLLDTLKATAAAVLASFAAPALASWVFGGTQISTAFLTVASAIPVLAGAGAFLGHIYPVWLGFKGGKGVATFIGTLLGVAWPLALVFCGVWLLTAFLSKMSSLAALVATLVVTAVVTLGGNRIGVPAEVMVALRPAVAAMSILLIVKHRDNIQRLLAGEEPRIGQGKSTGDTN